MAIKYKPQLQYPDIQDLSNQIRFVSQEGKIWLGEQRMLLMPLSAMANFRREMVDLLGIERAKGFFLRLGYQSGLKDAELARKLRPDSSELDIFLAGPQLHMLKGMLRSRPIEVDLDVEVSVLGPLEEIDPRDPGVIEIGRHGLVVEQGHRRGLLLPQVATEWGWGRDQFLSQTCVKAGLPPDSWCRGATVYRFTADVFGG